MFSRAVKEEERGQVLGSRRARPSPVGPTQPVAAAHLS